MMTFGSLIKFNALDSSVDLVNFRFLKSSGLSPLRMYSLVSSSNRLIPTTGVTLPFLSYGGTSMIVSMGMIGVLLNILNQSGKEEIR